MITIKGEIESKDKVLSFAETVINSLMPFFEKEINIDINIVPRCEDENSALCWGSKESAKIELAQKSYDVEFTLEDMMLNLAHELVHAKQFLNKELSSSLDEWKGCDYTHLPHNRRPWEKEAFLLEDELFKTYWK